MKNFSKYHSEIKGDGTMVGSNWVERGEHAFGRSFLGLCVLVLAMFALMIFLWGQIG